MYPREATTNHINVTLWARGDAVYHSWIREDEEVELTDTETDSSDSDTIRCRRAHVCMILTDQVVRYCLRKTFCANLFVWVTRCVFVRHCVTWVCNVASVFSTHGTTNIINAACTNFPPALPDGKKALFSIASATLSRDARPVSVYVSTCTVSVYVRMHKYVCIIFFAWPEMVWRHVLQNRWNRLQRQRLISTPSLNQVHAPVHSFTSMYTFSAHKISKFVQLSWTERCGDIDERSAANTGSTTRGYRVAQTTERESATCNSVHHMSLERLQLARSSALWYSSLSSLSDRAGPQIEDGPPRGNPGYHYVLTALILKASTLQF